MLRKINLPNTHRVPIGNVVLTALEKRSLKRANHVTDEIDRLIDNSDLYGSRPAGPIQVGATFTQAFEITGGVISDLRKRYPEITINMAATPDLLGPK